MSFYSFTDPERKEMCRSHIDNLEFWLRRLIHNELTKIYQKNYYTYVDEKTGHPIIKKDIVEAITYTYNKPDKKFSRWIDASLIEHVIYIVSSEKLYNPVFKQVFELGGYVNKEHLKWQLDTIAEVRNLVYHSNPISVRQVEQTICYSNDVIETIKKYYEHVGMAKEFSSPVFTRYSDSRGTALVFEDNGLDYGGTRVIKLADKPFFVGDEFLFQFEVSLGNDEYEVSFPTNTANFVFDKEKNTMSVVFTEDNLTQLFSISVLIKGTGKKWFRFSGGWDDSLLISYRVLPLD